MSKLRKQAIYGVLLVAPSLLTAGFAVVLLANEGRRLEESSLASARGRADLVARTIGLAVAETKSELVTSLAELPEESLAEELELWQGASPLVGSAFVCGGGGEIESVFGNLAKPFPFVRDGVPVWESPRPDPGSPGYRDPASDDPLVNVRTMKQKAAWRAKFDVLQRMQPQYGWVYAGGDRGLRLAAWYRSSGEGGAKVRALEVDLDELANGLKAFLPADPEPTQAFELVDGSGTPIHSVGAIGDAAPDSGFAVAIGPQLPGWELRGHHLWGKSPGSSLPLAGSLLVVLLVAAAISGGLLLIRQSRQDARHALQKSTFVSNVSHELKTPLTSIRMSAEVLSEGRVKDPARVAKHLGVITSESQRLARLVNNVLDFSRLEQGRKGFRPEVQNVIPLVEAALDSQRVALAEAGLEVRRGFDAGGEVEAVLDPDAVGAIMVNLIDNAIKYAAGGKLLDVRVEGSDPVRISVADAGPGVPATQREAIFERFHRVDDALTSRSGTGLGLSIARGLARGMGGDLCCRNGAGTGARFELTLPVAGP